MKEQKKGGGTKGPAGAGAAAAAVPGSPGAVTAEGQGAVGPGGDGGGQRNTARGQTSPDGKAQDTSGSGGSVGV